MDDGNEFRILHISDLHFSEGTDHSNSANAHSVTLLVGLEKAFNSLGNNDFVVVSGDVSNHGDKQSLINASGYIFNTIPIGQGRVTGLRLKPDQCGVVPGNHDAWNSKTTGSLISRTQQSLEHYNFAFNHNEIPEEYGCYYRWIEKENAGLYIAFVDSCFLGDPLEYKGSPSVQLRIDQAIAKGQLSIEQTKKLLEWHDLGVKGELQKTGNNGGYIHKDKYAQSLKILVMHHYLFEPDGYSSDYFMRVQDRGKVFKNVAMADFDLMLCGHKHIPSFTVHYYGQHFDQRALNRYLINCFRRMIGLHSMPIQLKDKKGKPWSKGLTWVSNVLTKLVKNREPAANPREVAAQVVALLRDGLERPDELENNIRRYLREHGVSGAAVVERRELREIRDRISDGLDVDERRQLRDTANIIAEVLKSLRSKPFIQSMSGSSAKATRDGERPRSFIQYKIIKETDGWEIEANRFNWDFSANAFDVDNPVGEVQFVRKNFEV